MLNRIPELSGFFCYLSSYFHRFIVKVLFGAIGVAPSFAVVGGILFRFVLSGF
jgi:hypothetical protein